jgi:hypothetical protein
MYAEIDKERFFHLISNLPTLQTEQVKGIPPSFTYAGKNIADKGITSGLKKISTPRCASGSIFSAALAATAATLRRCVPTHSATLH